MFCVEVRILLVDVSSLYHVFSRNATQDIRLGGKYSYPLTHLTGP